jgi:hypothetical protein
MPALPRINQGGFGRSAGDERSRGDDVPYPADYLSARLTTSINSAILRR